MNNFEIKIVKYFQEFGKGKLDFFTAVVSSVPVLAAFWISLTILLVWFFPEQRNDFLIRVMIVAILHFSISEGFFKYILPKFIKIRRRPYVEFPEIIKPIGHQFSDGSIPSSHMTSTVAMLLVICSIFPALVWPSIFLALFMSFARIHNGMHYPSDVIVGIILGMVYALISIRLF